MSKDLYILPHSLKPCECVDGSDTRYLYQYHASIVSPLKKPLNIESYNEKWFGTPPPTFSPPFKHSHVTLSFLSVITTPFSSLFNLHHETNTSPSLLLLSKADDVDRSTPTPATLHKSLLHSDGLFFIQYTPEDTLKQSWFLVQINMDETCKLDMEPPTTGDYHVTFLSCHPSDNHLCDDISPWWPLWYEYVLDTNNIPVYGVIILLEFNRKPDIKKCILWTDSVHLSDPSYYIHGLFNFESRSNIIKPNQCIALRDWEFFSLLVLLSVLLHLFSLTSPFLHLLKLQKEMVLAHLYTTAFILPLFWFYYLQINLSKGSTK